MAREFINNGSHGGVMVSPGEFARLVVGSLPYPVRASRGFFTFEHGGRTCLIDTFNGDLFVQPTVPSAGVLHRIVERQCPTCFHYSSPEAAFQCVNHLSQGGVHPVRVCVVADFQAERRMADLVVANEALSGTCLNPVQLKVLAMIIAFHEGMLPTDVQEAIDKLPDGASLRDGSCPFFAEVTRVKRDLILRNIARHERKRRFLDVLLGMQYLREGHHAIGTTYFNARIAELQARLQSLGASSPGP